MSVFARTVPPSIAFSIKNLGQRGVHGKPPAESGLLHQCFDVAYEDLCDLPIHPKEMGLFIVDIV